jgi:dolichol-phosphate mannosyltransferase
MTIKTITFVIPCFNESETVHEMYRRLSAIADDLDNYEFEFLFINDGSTDSTAEILNNFAKCDLRVKTLHFAHNQGHQIALSAGMDFATGDVIVTIDADLQDPPETIVDMLDKIQEGYDIVHAQRRVRSGETWFKLLTAKLFYLFVRKLSADALIKNCGDFRAFTRPVLEVARTFRERHKFLRANFVILGFKQCIIRYDRAPRYAGTTKYPFRKMVGFALDAILGFSPIPIGIVTFISFIVWIASFLYLLKCLIEHFFLHITVPGWTSLIALITFFASLNLFILTVIGSYIGRIFEQGQSRPLYWLSDARNICIEEVVRRAPDIPEVIISRNILKSKQREN